MDTPGFFERMGIRVDEFLERIKNREPKVSRETLEAWLHNADQVNSRWASNWNKLQKLFREYETAKGKRKALALKALREHIFSVVTAGGIVAGAITAEHISVKPAPDQK